MNTELPLTEHLPAREGNDRWAAVHDDEQNPLIALEERHLPAVLGAVRGLDVIDLGCGTGRQSVQLARAGASVTAVDFSAGMLAKARQRPDAAGMVLAWDCSVQLAEIPRASD